MTRDELIDVVAGALAELDRARRQLERDTTPKTNLPRPRRFFIAPGHVWPVVQGEDGKPDFSALESGDTWRYARDNRWTAERICQACAWQPRRVLRAVRRIQAAAAWCRARAEGRQRAAQEILKQQARAVEALEAERVLQGLQ